MQNFILIHPPSQNPYIPSQNIKLCQFKNIQYIQYIADSILKWNLNTWHLGENNPLPNDLQYYDLIKISISQNPSFIYPPLINILTQFKNFNPNDLVCIMNTFFPVKLNNIFPNLQNAPTYWVTFLGLASLIQCEYLVIYFLAMGSVPNMQNKFVQDQSYALINSSIIISNQQIQLNLERVTFILTLLASFKDGINLSQNTYLTQSPLFTSNINPNQPIISVLTSPLADLCKQGNLTSKSQFVMNLLIFILQNNEITNGDNSLKFFSNINAQSIPFGFTPLMYLIGNMTLHIEAKVLLIQLMMLHGANPMIMPNLLQNPEYPFYTNFIEYLKMLYPDVNDFQKIITELNKNASFQNKYQKIIKKVLSQPPQPPPPIPQSPSPIQPPGISTQTSNNYVNYLKNFIFLLQQILIQLGLPQNKLSQLDQLQPGQIQNMISKIQSSLPPAPTIRPQTFRPITPNTSLLAGIQGMGPSPDPTTVGTPSNWSGSTSSSSSSSPSISGFMPYQLLGSRNSQNSSSVGSQNFGLPQRVSSVGNNRSKKNL